MRANRTGVPAILGGALLLACLALAGRAPAQPVMVTIPAGTFEMGDHAGFVDPSHPSDEVPIHQVQLSAFLIGKTDVTVQHYRDFLASALAQGTIRVNSGMVYLTGGSDPLFLTRQADQYSRIGWDGTTFSVLDAKGDHPVTGVLWHGAAAYCNWLSTREGLSPCYNTSTWECDFTKNGYRLPTEAEWEYAGRGGRTSPYTSYPWGDTPDQARANWPSSGDPYETGPLPWTTPVGFYNGQLRRKADFNWPGSATSYQTSDGANGFGLYDMAGNVWQWTNDWYAQNYYSSSPAADPTGPSTGTPMPDGKPYRVLRGGNWFNGTMIGNVSDGHSRVSNRDPAYYRGPQDPNHPYYHVGFRPARRNTGGGTSQTQTVGLFINDSRAFPGYTLFAPKQNTMTHLIDNAGRIVHSWTKSTYEPGQSVVLMENGHLMRSCMTKGPLSTGGGEGGRIEEYDWEGNLVWQLDWSSAQYMQHHDFRLLPNGNVLLLAVEKKTVEEAIAAGFNPSKFQPEIASRGYMLPDYVVEIQPTRPVGGKVVWEWHVWDHLIQDYSSSKANYGNVAAHPERIDAAGDGKQIPAFWNHMNAIYYNAKLDQIALSVRGNSEVWIIDHSTTTAEAAGTTGGRRGKGGDLLYRWGNPATYRSGTVADQKLFQQHDTRWVDEDCPGAGNLMAFNNGLGRNYSTIDEWTPPLDADGNYTRTAGAAFGPKDFSWSYKATPPTALYAEAISSAQRLPNGNTLICDGTHGTFLEVTAAGETVWKYVNPVVKTGALAQGGAIPPDPARAGEFLNAVFRVQRYPTTYAGLSGRDLTPGGRVEIDPRPLATFTLSPSAPGVGQVVTFTDQSGNQPTSWAWNFGDGSTSPLKNPTHAYSAAGTYTVTLTATNASGSDTTSKSVVVTASSTGVSATLFLPIILDVSGRARYTSELSLTNRGTSDASVQLTYTASNSFSGLGSGTAAISLAAGRQLVVEDAIAYLRSQGLPIPDGDQGGSLRVTFDALSSADVASATVRVTAPSENGRAGVSYLAPRLEALPSNATSWLFGLRASAEDRTNIALANASTTSSITLRLTLVNGDDKTQTFPFQQLTLEPGQWKQINDVFAGTGFSQGYASVSVVSGTGPYFAYAVINNNETNDGSFAPFEVEPFPSEARLLPVVVESGPYTSDVLVTNTSSKEVSVELTYRESQSPDKGAGGTATEVLAAGQQKVISSILETLRKTVAGIGPLGGSYAGTLSVRFLSSGSTTTGYVGARTGSPSKSGTGRYGLFYGGVGTSSRARSAAWVYGLRQDTTVRANVAVAASPENPGAISVSVEVYDGESGKLVGTTAKVSLSPGGWYQWPNLLPQNGAKQGYVRVVNETATGTFTAYGVVNDGPAPGSQTGTDDGSFIPAVPVTETDAPSITQGRAQISGVGSISSTDGRVWTVPALVSFTTAAKASDI